MDFLQLSASNWCHLVAATSNGLERFIASYTLRNFFALEFQSNRNGFQCLRSYIVSPSNFGPFSLMPITHLVYLHVLVTNWRKANMEEYEGGLHLVMDDPQLRKNHKKVNYLEECL